MTETPEHCLDTAFEHLRSEKSLESESEADVETITTLAQLILKRERQRVKRGA